MFVEKNNSMSGNSKATRTTDHSGDDMHLNEWHLDSMSGNSKAKGQQIIQVMTCT